MKTRLAVNDGYIFEALYNIAFSIRRQTDADNIQINFSIDGRLLYDTVQDAMMWINELPIYIYIKTLDAAIQPIYIYIKTLDAAIHTTSFLPMGRYAVNIPICLTLNVLEPSYLGLTRSIS